MLFGRFSLSLADRLGTGGATGAEVELSWHSCELGRFTGLVADMVPDPNGDFLFLSMWLTMDFCVAACSYGFAETKLRIVPAA